MANLNTLPPPPTGQTGTNPNLFSHLPPPPTGQTGMTLQQVQAQNQPQSGGFLSGASKVLGAAEKPFLDVAATPVQAIAKALGRPDPFAQGLPSGLPGMGDKTNVNPLTGNPLTDLKNKGLSAAQIGLMAAPGGMEGLAPEATVAAKAVNLAKNTAISGGLGYAGDVTSNLQAGTPNPLTPGAGTKLGLMIPGIGAIANGILGTGARVAKSLGAAEAGVSSGTIGDIVNNPQSAGAALSKLSQVGNRGVLTDNVNTIMNGVKQVRAESSAAYGKGLDALSATDIKPENLQKGFFDALKENKISIGEDGKPDFSKADFGEPRMQARATDLINTINQQKDLSGKGVRSLLDKIDNSRFSKAPDGERQAYNAFVDDLHNGLKDGISASTNKLDEINAKYSEDRGLADAVQGELGKVKYGNRSEIVAASKKIEGLFSKTGLAPSTIDDFLNRIGVNPQEYRTSEAIRQMGNKEIGASGEGASFGKAMRAVTSGIVTPLNVAHLARYTGLAKQDLQPFLKNLKPAVRNMLLRAASNQAAREQQSQGQGETQTL